jgi:hypothetical protein
MPGFIDPPSPFAPTKSWEDFLAGMRRLPQNDPDVQREMKLAEQELARRRNRELQD